MLPVDQFSLRPPKAALFGRLSFAVSLILLTALALPILRAGSVVAQRSDTKPALIHVQRAHYLMGTVFSIETYHTAGPQAEAAIEAAFQSIRDADELMSHYREDSQLSLLNREAAKRPVAVRRDLYELLRRAQQLSRSTGGAFDITTNSLTVAWQQAEQRNATLDKAELAQARKLLGADRLILDDHNSTVRFDRLGVRIDLGGIAKGWAVDGAAAILRKRGITSALISAGSSTLYAIGTPPGEAAWTIGIRDARISGEDDAAASPENILAVVELRDMSMSTSSSSERFFSIRGQRYSHVLDPRTGMPAAAMSSATVVAPSATESDALSTAVFVQGSQAGAALLKRLECGGFLVRQQESSDQMVTTTVPYPGGQARIWAGPVRRVS